MGNFNAKSIGLFWTFISGVLLGVSAFPSSFYVLNFFAFLPFLFAIVHAKKHALSYSFYFLQLLIFLATFFLIVGFWVLQTANLGFLIGILIILPHLIFLFPFYWMFKRTETWAFVYLACAWLAAEFVQEYFELGSPFFNLGHSLSATPQLIQWYSLTGSAGGTLWVLLVNVLSFQLLIRFKQRLHLKKQMAVLLLVVLIPLVASLGIYHSFSEQGKSASVLVVHPSTDNTDMKYQLNIYDLLDIYLDIALPKMNPETDYVVLPETALTNTGWVEDYGRNLVFQHWFEKTSPYPNVKLISGAVAYESISDVTKIPHYEKIPGIRFSEKYQRWYRTYNAAIQLERGQMPQIRAKEGLVPFQEYAPYPHLLPRIAPVGIDFQFSKRPHNQTVFQSANRQTTAALVCYETVLGSLFTWAARQGAEAFFVLLNEGWYRDPDVPQQFLQLSVVRAIENRRSVVHSSNMGISAVINQRGDVLQQTHSKQPTCLNAEIHLNKQRTLASLLGNYLGLLALIGSLGILVRTFGSSKIKIKKGAK